MEPNPFLTLCCCFFPGTYLSERKGQQRKRGDVTSTVMGLFVQIRCTSQEHRSAMSKKQVQGSKAWHLFCSLFLNMQIKTWAFLFCISFLNAGLILLLLRLIAELSTSMDQFFCLISFQKALLVLALNVGFLHPVRGRPVVEHISLVNLKRGNVPKPPFPSQSSCLVHVMPCDATPCGAAPCDGVLCHCLPPLGRCGSAKGALHLWHTPNVCISTSFSHLQLCGFSKLSPGVDSISYVFWIWTKEVSSQAYNAAYQACLSVLPKSLQDKKKWVNFFIFVQFLTDFC